MGPLLPRIPRMPRSGLRTAGFGFVDLQALLACGVQPCVTRTRREGARGGEPDVADTSRAQAGRGGRGPHGQAVRSPRRSGGYTGFSASRESQRRRSSRLERTLTKPASRRKRASSCSV